MCLTEASMHKDRKGLRLYLALLLRLPCAHAVARSATPSLRLVEATQAQATKASHGLQSGGDRQQPDVFFSSDSEKLEELPSYNLNNKDTQCHPRCRWSCGKSACDTKCEPRCKAPKCVSACKKPSLVRCKRVCKEPQCAVVCPQQCEHGSCPMCKTVCAAAMCSMQCGEARCESRCADPECTWDCKADPACAKPSCKMTCDSTVCSFGEAQRLPSESEVHLTGQEVGSIGLGKLPPLYAATLSPHPVENMPFLQEPPDAKEPWRIEKMGALRAQHD